MPNDEQVEILKQGPNAWNEWRSLNKSAVIDLSEADLHDVDLAGSLWPVGTVPHGSLPSAMRFDLRPQRVDLSAANLAGADLSRADLTSAFLLNANLSGATLVGADLTKAVLMSADLSDAILTQVNLTHADLTHANLTGATLWFTVLAETHMEGANLTRASLYNVMLACLDLTQTVGLETCVHRGPSMIDHRTLVFSRSLPLPFLRGCGLPESVIDYLPSLLNDAAPIQFYSCFISYATANQDFASRLYADLQNKGVRCWFAPHNMQGGKKIHEQIDEAIRVYDRLLLILSRESLASEWVATEIAHAREKEAVRKRRVLFPISIVPYEAVRSWKLFDADRGKDSAKEIREYYIPDFTEWKDHDLYTKAFNGLLKALESDDARPAAG
jgi:hypothetical protein